LRRWLRAARPVSPAPAPPPYDESLTAYHEGRYGDAEKLLAAALKRAERQAAGAPALARALSNLADLYRTQARWEEAETFYQRALDLEEAQLGRDHPSLVRTLNSLALVYRGQGLYDRAEPLCQRALEIVERVHGAGHPNTAPVVGNLLTVYLAQGRYGDAGPLFRRSVAIKERVLGPKHPALAGSFSNYAAFLRKTRGDAEAAAWEARARAIRGE